MDNIRKLRHNALRRINNTWNALRLIERRRLSGDKKRFLELLDSDTQKALELFDSFMERLERAEKHSLVRHAANLKCDFFESLPISSRIDEIVEAIRSNSVVIVRGSTGSGKTTQLPKAALKAGLGRTGRIGVTQPRRIAACALASRLAAETGTATGREVGYKVRFDDSTSESTVIKFMTDGILLAETRSDPALLQYDCIIIDEVHERSLNIDFLLGYIKLLLSRRKNLRVIISSATIETGRLAEFFADAPVIEVEGRTFPIEDAYLEPEEDEELSESVARGVEFLTSLDNSGDILVFLPGEREIRECFEMLEGRSWAGTEILPLFGRLSAQDQQKIFKRSGTSRRRIVLATNVAETSLTIPGIRFVIDSGLVRLSRYNPKNRIQELRIEFISQAASRQRRGRCGRMEDGVCVHLYSEQTLLDAPEFTDPEICRSSLAGVVLAMAMLNLPKVEHFPFIDQPASSLIREAYLELTDIGALDSHGQLTNDGTLIAELPVDPHLGRILIDSERRSVFSELAVIVAFLSIPDVRERPFDNAKEADAAQKKFLSDESDFITILKIWNAVQEELGKSKTSLRKFAKSHYLNYRRLHEWRNLVCDIGDMFSGDEPFATENLVFNEETLLYNDIHKSLLSGMPRQLAAFDREKLLYYERSAKTFTIFPASGLVKHKSKPDWILFFALVETSRLFARCCAKVKPEWLEEVAPGLCTKSYDMIKYDPQSGFVVSRERVSSGRLILNPGRRRHYGNIEPAKAREVFIREGLVNCVVDSKVAPWVKKYNLLIESLAKLELKKRRPESIIDADAIYGWFDEHLPVNFSSNENLKRNFMRTKKSYCPATDDIIYEQYEDLNEQDFPDTVTFSGLEIPLTYEFDPGEGSDGVTMHIQEDELNLIEPYKTDYIVPGYLVWKVEHLLRAMPKAVRKEIMPLAQCVELFMELYRAGKLFTDQKLSRTLSDFLSEEYRADCPAAYFDDLELPEFLIMKSALYKNGKIVKVIREFPDVMTLDSRLSKSHSESKKYEASSCRFWPEGKVLPESVIVSPDGSKMAYPALFDESENTVGCMLYLDLYDAKLNHERGIFRLYRLNQNIIVRHLKSTAKLSHKVELSLFMDYRSWKDDLIDLAIRESMGSDLWKIRNEKTFISAMESSRDCIGEIFAEKLAALSELAVMYDKALENANRLPDDSETYADACDQLDFLFRDGFLRTYAAFEQYKRYLKSLITRLERANHALAKDISKGAGIARHIKRFQISEGYEKPLETMPFLYEYFMLIEEARISAYTPEIPTIMKASPDALDKFWEK